MRSLSDSDFLNLWEGGLRRHPLDRALMALSAVLPVTTYERIADWPLGRRNKALAELHCGSFGRSIQGWVSCASCAEKLEFELDGREIAVGEQDGDEPSADKRLRFDELDSDTGSGKLIVVKRGTFRLPTSRDLAKAAQEADLRSAAIRIVENCRMVPQSPAAPTEPEGTSAQVPELRPESWSDEELDEIGEKMALADPLAETRLTLHCPKCDTDFEEALDLVSFLWAEIEARARRLLLQIHTLASAYGWSETEILSLSDDRRARYVEMVQS